MTDVQLSSRVEQVEAASLVAQLQKVPVFAGVSYEGLSCLGTVELIHADAGADLYEKDLLGGLDITKEGIAERDRIVFENCLRRNIPVAVTLGGGYAAKLEDTILIHAVTLKTAIECTQRLWTSVSTR